MKHKKHLNLIVIITLFYGILLHTQAVARPWTEIVDSAKGQTVDWYMWGGSPAANTYVNGYVVPEMKRRYDITVRQVPIKDISEIVSKILVEKQAGKNSDGKVDLMWINGENFRTCKRNDLLFGPFADQLPNGKYVDWTRPSVKNDFGEPVEGLESPWGSAQVVMIYDSGRTPNPPRSLGDLIAWIRENPGRFAYPAPPDFTGSVFVRHVFYHVSGEVQLWQSNSDPEVFDTAAMATYSLLKGLAPSLWRGGRTYPESPIRLAHLFADREIDFAFSYHPADASKKIHDGLYPASVRTFIFDEGTISNTHFVAIPFNAGDKEGAMILADFLISPEAQLAKADQENWGDFPAIEVSRLNAGWRRKFRDLPLGIATLPNDVLQAHQLPEPPSEILIELEKGWQTHVLKAR
ncbi:MAG: ABC transporter substrate-binding protein [Desulfobacteraceae bacterium]|nr:ABC transporter substrate-binding protein [Desulfobacteraceae bacterium]